MESTSTTHQTTNNPVDQLKAVRDRQVQADLSLIGVPKGFTAPFSVLLFGAFANGDVPDPWRIPVVVIVLLGLIAMTFWLMKSKPAAPSVRYKAAVQGPLVAFAAVVGLALVVAEVGYHLAGGPLPGVFVGAVFVIVTTVGTKLTNDAIARRVAQQR